MKDSQHCIVHELGYGKYIKANNERFSTLDSLPVAPYVSISRRIMKDSQLKDVGKLIGFKYIKANNERFSTVEVDGGGLV